MKKGQIEIAGLLVIVVLISLVLLFVVSFSVNKEIDKDPVKKDVKDTNIRASFSSVLLETSTDCEGRTVRQLITDCAFPKQIQCGLLDSCEYSEIEIQSILDSFLNKIGYSFNLAVKTESNPNVLYFSDGECDDTADTIQRSQTHVGTQYGTIWLVLSQCI